VVGSDGVWAANPITGNVRAILNADSPINQVAPLTMDPDRNNTRVVSYFVEAGLPSDQIASAHVLASMQSSGGPSTNLEDSADPQFLGYTSVLVRAVSGINLPDSFAAARFDADDEVTMEWIYWPPIPTAVIDAARSLRATLDDPNSRGAFLTSTAVVGIDELPGEVTIRHSDFDDEHFQAFASYDVQVPAGKLGRIRGTTLNFGTDGKAIVHPNRRPTAIQASANRGTK
jgi:hypothetical protein